jgi:hypothetical protein
MPASMVSRLFFKMSRKKVKLSGVSGRHGSQIRFFRRFRIEMSRKNIKLSGVCASTCALRRKNRVDTPDRFGILRDILHFEPMLGHQIAPQRHCTPDTFGILRDISDL